MDMASMERLAERAALRFEAETSHAREVFARAERSQGQEIRLRRRGDRPGRSSCSVRYVGAGRAGEGFLVHCFKTGQGAFFGLSTPAGPGAAAEAPARSRCAVGRNPEREERQALARTIAEEGLPPGAERRGGARPDYALFKGLAGFRLPTANAGPVPPCPAIRYAARDYALRGRRLLLAGTPFWALRERHGGGVCGVQFKFWSRRANAWCTRTIGSQANAWVALPPEASAADGAAAAVVLAEGISTAWALHCLLAGAHRVIATLGISGLLPSARAAARCWPGRGIAIAADLDRGGQGEAAARRAAAAVRGAVLLPLLRAAGATAIARARAQGFDAWDLWAQLGGQALCGGLEALLPDPSS